MLLLHLAAAMPVARYVEYLTPTPYIDDILVEPFPLDENGYLTIPDTPGLVNPWTTVLEDHPMGLRKWVCGVSCFMALTTLSTTVDAGNAGRVDLVVRQLSGSSRSQIRGMVDHGCVSINGTRCDAVNAAVAAGDVVSIRFDSQQRYHEKKKRWDDRTFTVALEDKQ